MFESVCTHANKNKINVGMQQHKSFYKRSTKCCTVTTKYLVMSCRKKRTNRARSNPFFCGGSKNRIFVGPFLEENILIVGIFLFFYHKAKRKDLFF